jgi:hypothetical protein
MAAIDEIVKAGDDPRLVGIGDTAIGNNTIVTSLPAAPVSVAMSCVPVIHGWKSSLRRRCRAFQAENCSYSSNARLRSTPHA